ncbi:CotH kinase family protein [Haloferula sp. BvORR071]|uniref:CotH kinase family protein n=1 Tax=Haloferula sp. BvORR071 TaxID=1396141 RepID=UPI000695F808|nr:CotH kinase family protein [Haloferula sp. BvORR071]
MQSERKLLADFDKDGNKQLNQEERAAAREFLKANPAQQRGGFPGGPGGGGRRGPGGFGPRGGAEETPATPGVKISPSEVSPAGSSDLYAEDTLRTLFLDFENADWEKELEDFHGTDVEVPATLTVDGKKYPGVGVHFRGMSSYMMVSAGHKRSLNVSLDFSDKKQKLDGYKTLNLLNSHEDGSFLSAVLYSHIARQHIAAPKANLVRVVINGENWGVYVNQEQFNKDFIQENFRSNKGARWKVRGSPNGRGGLDYAGEDLAVYKERYDMKDGTDEDWQALIKLCKTLSQTPAGELEAAVAPMLDIDSVLWFLALDCGLINGDGYWTRASDFSLYRDTDGRFHLIPGDMNEAFRPSGGGPGFGPRGGGGDRGGFGPPGGEGRPEGGQPRPEGPGQQGPGAGGGNRGGEGVKLDPLTGMDNERTPLRSKLLAVPALKARYLEKVRTIAQENLDWSKLGPVVAKYRELAGKEIAADTRKLSSTEEFEKLTADQPAAASGEEAPRGFGPSSMALRTFADQRRAYLLSATAAKKE